MESCLGFNVDCGTLVKGAGVTVMGFILFVGSVYLILTAVLGRWTRRSPTQPARRSSPACTG